MSTQPACFVDRDGVIIRDVGYLSNPDDLELIAGAGEAISRLNEAGVPVVDGKMMAIGDAQGVIDLYLNPE